MDAARPDRLSSQEHWERVHGHDSLERAAGPRRFPKARQWVREFLRRERISPYVLWREILPRYLQKPPGSTVVEIGSAPGSNLVRFARQFGFSPFGIEYTLAGAEANRALFRREGIPEDRVIQGDLFDDALLERYRDRFDIVFSSGLIEHFEDVRSVIVRHTRLLAPGGLLVLAVPRLRGFNRLLCRLSCPGVLDIHNLTIMTRKPWESLFEGIGTRRLYSGYYGALDLGLIDGHPSRLGPLFLKATRIADAVLSAILRRLPASLRPETGWFSPYVIYIGQKGFAGNEAVAATPVDNTPS